LENYLVDVVLVPIIVQLPQVNVIGLQTASASLNHAHGTIARPLFRFGSQNAARCGAASSTF